MKARAATQPPTTSRREVRGRGTAQRRTARRGQQAGRSTRPRSEQRPRRRLSRRTAGCRRAQDHPGQRRDTPLHRALQVRQPHLFRLHLQLDHRAVYVHDDGAQPQLGVGATRRLGEEPADVVGIGTGGQPERRGQARVPDLHLRHHAVVGHRRHVASRVGPTVQAERLAGGDAAPVGRDTVAGAVEGHLLQVGQGGDGRAQPQRVDAVHVHDEPRRDLLVRTRAEDVGQGAGATRRRADLNGRDASCPGLGRAWPHVGGTIGVEDLDAPLRDSDHLDDRTGRPERPFGDGRGAG